MRQKLREGAGLVLCFEKLFDHPARAYGGEPWTGVLMAVLPVSCGSTGASRPQGALATSTTVRAVSACDQLSGAKRKHWREYGDERHEEVGPKGDQGPAYHEARELDEQIDVAREVTDAFRVPIDQTFRSARAADHLSFIDSGSCGSPS